MDIRALAAEQHSYIKAMRQHFHNNPELGMKEDATVARIMEELVEMGIPHREVPAGGVIGVVEGALPGKTLLLRADIDALPMQESEKNLKFERDCRSQVDGVMHACGHDGHAAMLLGAARVLQNNRDKLKGRYLLVFERGEEVFGGVRNIIKELDATEQVDGCWGVHLMPALPSGTVGVRPGPLMSGPFGFGYTIHGRGGHGSRPDLCVSPVDVFVDIYQATQNLMAFHSNPFYPVTFSIGSVQSGTVSNIIPDDLTFTGNFRILDYDKVGEFYAVNFHRIVKEACARYGATYTRNRYSPTDLAVVNNEVAAGIAAAAVQKVLGPDGLVVCEPMMGSECYSLYQKRSPGVFCIVGTRNLEKGIGADNHNTAFDLDYDALEAGCAATLQYALDFQEFEGDFAFTPDPTPADQLLSPKYMDKVGE